MHAYAMCVCINARAHTHTLVFFQMNMGEKCIRETFQKKIKIVMLVT